MLATTQEISSGAAENFSDDTKGPSGTKVTAEAVRRSKSCADRLDGVMPDEIRRTMTVRISILDAKVAVHEMAKPELECSGIKFCGFFAVMLLYGLAMLAASYEYEYCKLSAGRGDDELSPEDLAGLVEIIAEQTHALLQEKIGEWKTFYVPCLDDKSKPEAEAFFQSLERKHSLEDVRHYFQAGIQALAEKQEQPLDTDIADGAELVIKILSDLHNDMDVMSQKWEYKSDQDATKVRDFREAEMTRFKSEAASASITHGELTQA